MKQHIIYHEWLLGNGDVEGKTPALTKKLSPVIDLELYVGDSGKGKNTWATAIIAVNSPRYIYRFKYDGGHIDNDLEVMAYECESVIKTSWDLKTWVHDAEYQYKKRVPWFKRLLTDLLVRKEVKNNG